MHIGATQLSKLIASSRQQLLVSRPWHHLQTAAWTVLSLQALLLGSKTLALYVALKVEGRALKQRWRPASGWRLPPKDVPLYCLVSFPAPWLLQLHPG
jgi:hypothetical protein